VLNAGKFRSPAALVGTLDPPGHAVIKREERVVVWRETRPDGERTVVKLYRRRGRLGALRSRLTRFRAEREFRRLRHLVRWGVPCTVPLAWSHGHSPEHGYHEVLVMREVPNAVQLEQHLREREGRVPLAPLFRIVRRMHESGFCNQTLYAYNVLVSRDAEPGEEFFLADVPRSWTFPRSIVGTGMALFDLLDLTVEVEEAGVAPAAVPLEAYGLGETGMRWWARHAGEDPRTKRTRAVRDALARVRWAAAWGLRVRRRSEPPGDVESSPAA
jgi:tRNA A-37 threonylcarbamoyl transferase component Bud32